MSAATLSSEQADSRVLAAADQLFYPRGVGAVTMADIRDMAGVSLRRLYALYPAKSDLIAGWLHYRHNAWSQWFSSQIEQSIAAGSKATDAVFDALSAWLVETDYRGCGFINTLIEGHELTHEHREIIAQHKGALITTLAQHSSDAAAMAVLVDGAIVQSAVFRSDEPVEAARRVASRIPPLASPTPQKAAQS